MGYEIAKALNLPLDVIIPRKIGAPDNPELAIGAMTEDGTIILDNNLVAFILVFLMSTLKKRANGKKSKLNADSKCIQAK